MDVQRVVDAHPGRTTFCLKAGVHAIAKSITPRTGNTFVGEYGAILDGAGWVTTDSTQGAFRAHNQDIDAVTIRNLVIRNMPQKGIHAFSDFSDHWTIEHNEIVGARTGLNAPNDTVVRWNRIHHNIGNRTAANPAERGGGYAAYRASRVLFEGNEIAYNGTEQKMMESVDVTFRRNFVHHNVGDGIWYDGGNPGALVEGNRVEDNGRNGIFYEVSSGGTIRNNVIRRSADTGVFVSTSTNTHVHSNTLEHNFRGITYFVNCSSAGGDAIGVDLANNSARDNTIAVGARTDAFAAGFSHTLCTPMQVAPYLNGSKNLTFSHNTYRVPSAAGRYWLWDGLKPWSQWQSLGHDVDGVVSE
jgi:parallel beta-helix repeat protein